MRHASLLVLFVTATLVMIPIRLKGGVPENCDPESRIATSAIVQTSQQDYPLGIPFFSRRKIQEIVPAVGNGVKAYLVFTRLKKQGGDNDVMEIYYVKHSYQDDNPEHYPPRVDGLIYHNLGEDKEFLGIKIYEPIYPDDGTVAGMISEVRLDDTSAQYLLDFRTGDTKWIDKTGLGEISGLTFEITNSSKVMVPKVID